MWHKALVKQRYAPLGTLHCFFGIEHDTEEEAHVPRPLRLRSRGGRQHRLRPLPRFLIAALHVAPFVDVAHRDPGFVQRAIFDHSFYIYYFFN